MKRILELEKQIIGFDGEPLKKESDKEDIATLKDCLLTVIRNSQNMGVSEQDLNQLYIIGLKIGQADDKVELTTKQYEVLKKIVDYGKVKTQQGEMPLFPNLEVIGSIQKMIEEAEAVKEEKEPAEEEPKK